MRQLDPDDRYFFVFRAPDEQPTSWNLSYDHAEASLQRVDASCTVKRGPYDRFRYGVVFPFGDAEGNVSADHDGITIEGVTIATAAQFLVWLRQELLPAGAGICFKTGESVELGLEAGEVPDSLDAGEIAAVLDAHIRAALADGA